jgi:hypothetical protein
MGRDKAEDGDRLHSTGIVSNIASVSCTSPIFKVHVGDTQYSCTQDDCRGLDAVHLVMFLMGRDADCTIYGYGRTPYGEHTALGRTVRQPYLHV